MLMSALHKKATSCPHCILVNYIHVYTLTQAVCESANVMALLCVIISLHGYGI